MKFFEGDVKNAISKRKTFCSAFIVFVENKDPESERFRQALEEENSIPVKDYVAFRVSAPSDSFRFFRDIYREVPVPSLVIIGRDGQPIRVLSSCDPREDLYAAIREALALHKADPAAAAAAAAAAAGRPDRLRPEGVQILLKLPGGQTALLEFRERTRLGEVRAFVRESLQVRGPFQMINPFPRKLFAPEDEARTLLDLRLAPTSTILVVPEDRRQLWAPAPVSHLVSRAYVTMRWALLSAKDWFWSVLAAARR